MNLKQRNNAWKTPIIWQNNEIKGDKGRTSTSIWHFHNQATTIFIIKLLSLRKMFITQDVNENMKTFVQKYINFVEKQLKYAHFEGNIKP